MALAGVCSSSGLANESGYGNLIQPKIVELIQQANTAQLRGENARAMACAEAVTMPGSVKVRVFLDGVPLDQQLKISSAVERSLKQWEQAVDGQTQFEIVSSGPASIRIRAANSVRLMGKEIAGHAVWSRDVQDWGLGQFRAKVSADIDLRYERPDGGYFSEDALVHATMHELGHVLGLWDSPEIGTIMGPLQLDRPVTALSQSEINSLMSARNQAWIVAEACGASQMAARFPGRNSR